MLHVLVAVLLAVAALSFADVASAQSITVVNESSLPRLNKEGQIIQKRPLNLSPEAVNLQDCYDDQLIRFTLQMGGFQPNATIEVWASNSGADCKQQTVRTGLSPQCWKALDTNIPLQTVVDVDIPVRNIMAGAPPNQPHQPNRDEEALCGKVDLATITVHFLYFAPGQQANAAYEKTVGITVDTVGPKPPSGLKALPGNTRIQVSWINISGGSGDAGATGGLTELTGVKVYCDVAGSTPTTVQNQPVCHEEERDAGVDDAGNPITETVEVCEDGGTTTREDPASGCSSANFRNPDNTPIFPSAEFNKKYECGSITGNTGTTVVATQIAGKPLVNGTTYAVAVAATDKFGNVGQLSEVVCETPEETTDFWQEYRNAGGDAGGGCSTSGAALPVGSITVLLLAVVTAGLTLRRRTGSRSFGLWIGEREDRR
jgi:hypothetical protein